MSFRLKEPTQISDRSASKSRELSLKTVTSKIKNCSLPKKNIPWKRSVQTRQVKADGSHSGLELTRGNTDGVSPRDQVVPSTARPAHAAPMGPAALQLSSALKASPAPLHSALPGVALSFERC